MTRDQKLKTAHILWDAQGTGTYSALMDYMSNRINELHDAMDVCDVEREMFRMQGSVRELGNLMRLMTPPTQ